MMDGGVLSTSAITSSFTAILRISQAVYELKAVGEQTRDLLDTTKHIDESMRAVRRIRRQKSELLNETEKEWIDGVLRNTEKAVGTVAKLIEPARVDMVSGRSFAEGGKLNTKDIKLWHRTLFVLKDSPKVSVNLMTVCVATQGLNSAMVVLCNREGYKSGPFLDAPLNGGTVRRRASSPGGRAPPPYDEKDYEGFLNRRRTIIDRKKKKKLLPQQSKVSFVVGDDDRLDTLDEDEDVARVPGSGRWVEPEDILDPARRGLQAGQVRPDPLLQSETIHLAETVIPQTADRFDLTPACAPESQLPLIGDEYPDEAVQRLWQRHFASDQLLKNTKDFNRDLSGAHHLSWQPSGALVPDTNQSLPDRSASTGSRPTFRDEFLRTPPQTSSKYVHPQMAGQAVNHNIPQQGAHVPPPVPSWTHPSIHRAQHTTTPQSSLPHPGSPKYNNNSRGVYAQSGEDPYGRTFAIRPSTNPSHAHIPCPPSSQHQHHQYSRPYQSPDSLSPNSAVSPPMQFPHLKHTSSAPAVPQIHKTYTQYRDQLPSQPQRPTSDVYTHLTQSHSIDTAQAKEPPDSRFHLPERIETPTTPQAHKRANFSFSSTHSTHSYEPFDPAAIKTKPLPPTPPDQSRPLSSFVRASSLSSPTYKDDEPSAFEYAAVSDPSLTQITNPSSRHHPEQQPHRQPSDIRGPRGLGIGGVGVGVVVNDDDSTTKSHNVESKRVNRGRAALEYRTNMAS